MNENKLFEEELINAVDLEAAPPTKEPERQYYYIAKARKYVKELSEKLGRPLFAHVTTFGWAVVSTYSEEVKEGAVEFLKFRTKFNLEEKKELMDKNGRTEISQLLQDYVNAYNNNPQIVPNYQVKWNSILQEETIGECLPQLAAGKMTPAQMVETADESIREYEKER